MVNLPQWLEYIQQQIGFVLPVAQHHWVERAITTTANKYAIDVDELWIRVHTDITLRQALFDAIVIGESRFFRHLPSIDFIVKQARESSNLTMGFKVWSVGCSQGQEAWSVAMALSHVGIDNYQIVGTDVSNTALQSARQAVYNDREKAIVPEQYHGFMKALPIDTKAGSGRQKYKIVDSLHTRVSFTWYNLLSSEQATISVTGVLYDVIICQNVLIYFSKSDQYTILDKLVQSCKIGGYLVLAPNEGMSWYHTDMQKRANSQVNVWQKVR